MPTQITNWGLAGLTATGAALSNLLGWLPRLLGAIVILLVGWGIAVLVGKLTDRALDAIHFDRWMQRAHVDEAIARTGMRLDPSDLVGQLVKWGVFLLAILVASDALGLPQVTAALNGVLGYIPDVIAAILILKFGALLATFVGNVVSAAPFAASRTLGQVAYWAVIVFAAMAALTQLRIAPGLVQTLFTAIIGSVALAAAIAFGLGLRRQAEDLMVSAGIKALCREGDVISVQNVDGQSVTGRIEHIGPSVTRLQVQQGKVLVPNRMLSEHLTTIQVGAAAPQLKITRMEEMPAAEAPIVE